MKITLILFFALFFIGLSFRSFAFFEKSPYEPKEKNPLKLEFNSEVLRKLKKILPPGTKIESYPELRSGHRPTDRMEFDFILPNVVTNDPEEVKNLFLSYLEKIIDILNTTPQMRPYLKIFPMDSESLSISMLLAYEGDPHKTADGQPRVHAASFQFGKIRVGRWVYRENSCQWESEDCLTLSPQELGDILTPKSLLFKEIKRELSIPSDKKYEGIFPDGIKERFQFSVRYAQKEGYIYLCDELYLRHGFTNQEERINVCLRNTYCAQEKRLTLEEAKKFIRKASLEQLSYYQKEEMAIRQVKKIQTRKNVPIDGKARQENLSLRFIFWDKYIDYIQPPYIAEIYTFGRKVSYFTSDDCQRLVLVAQEELPNEGDETKEEAVKTS